MTKEQLIELGLSEEQATAVIGKYGNMVPQHRFNEVIAEKNEYKEQLTERDKQLTELNKSVKDNKELSDKIKELQEINTQNEKNYNEKLTQMKLDSQIELELTKMGAKDNIPVKALLSRDTIKFENNKVVGLEEQLKALKESHSYMFNSEEPTNPSGFTPKTGEPKQENKSWADIISGVYNK